MNIKRLILTPLFIFGVFAATYADGTQEDPEVLHKYRFSSEFKIKLTKGLNLNLTPELRFNDGLDLFLINGEITYKTFGCLYWGATYRLVMDRYENGSTTNPFGGSSTNYDWRSYHRYAFDVTYKEKFGRFEPSFRLRYNNFIDDQTDDSEYLRYRAKVEYDIRKSKFTPHIAVEAYQQMSDGELYKMRYGGGIEAKTGKNSALSLGYKFDFFILEYKNANIFELGYKYKF